MTLAAARRSAKAAPSPADAASAVIGKICEAGTLAPVSCARVTELIRGFARFLGAAGVADLASIQPRHADAFVRSLTRSGTEPSLATMHLRRSAIRIFFREAKGLHLLDYDPSTNIALPKRAYRDLRPLTDSQIARCRSFAAGVAGDSMFAAAWTLAEASARVPELSHVTVGDFDPEAGIVRLPGCSSTAARRASLTPWGVEHLAARLAANPELEVSQPLLGSGSRGSMHELIASTLRRAGLANRVGIRPNSVPAWRGVTELGKGASIDEVAVLLGMRSLDRTAAFIGFDWRSEP
jgi:site-specific recombinase XerC